MKTEHNKALFFVHVAFLLGALKENPLLDSIICIISLIFHGMADVSQNKNVLITVLLIAVLAGASYWVYRSSNTPVETANADQNIVPPVTQQDVPSAVSASYKDGEYNVVGNYMSPGGAEEMGVKITLKDNVIIDAAIEPKSTRPISKKMQEVVAKDFKPMVIGKKIDEVKLDTISGASLTPKGFNDAVAKIKIQAQA